jgi:hypothetical protein
VSNKVWEAIRNTYIFEHISRFFFTPIALAPEKPYYLAEKLCWEVKWVNLSYGSRYDFMRNECGMAFASLVEYITHCNRYHPKAAGTSQSLSLEEEGR